MKWALAKRWLVKNLHGPGAVLPDLAILYFTAVISETNGNIVCYMDRTISVSWRWISLLAPLTLIICMKHEGVETSTVFNSTEIFAWIFELRIAGLKYFLEEKKNDPYWNAIFPEIHSELLQCLAFPCWTGCTLQCFSLPSPAKTFKKMFFRIRI